jgi:exosortase
MDNVRMNNANKLWWGFCVYMMIWLAVYFTALRELVLMAGRSDLYSHTVLIPFVSAYVLFQERRTIFSSVRPALGAGMAVLGVGIVAYGFRLLQGSALDAQTRLTLSISAACVALDGGFLLVFGGRAFKKALFPLLFLVFMIPLPEPVVDQIVPFLQNGSAEVTDLIFKFLGVTFLRDGLSFHLARVSVHIAPECSSFRSSLALLITGTVAAKLFLGRWWSRSALVLITIPLALVKNAIRIVTLTLLAQHVDMGFLTGHWLHQSGGFVFFLITLTLFGGSLLLLRWAEGKDRTR